MFPLIHVMQITLLLVKETKCSRMFTIGTGIKSDVSHLHVLFIYSPRVAREIQITFGEEDSTRPRAALRPL